MNAPERTHINLTVPQSNRIESNQTKTKIQHSDWNSKEPNRKCEWSSIATKKRLTTHWIEKMAHARCRIARSYHCCCCCGCHCLCCWWRCCWCWWCSHIFRRKICNGVDKEIYDIERNHCIVKIGRILLSLKKAMIPLSIWFYDVINLSLPLFFLVFFLCLSRLLSDCVCRLSLIHSLTRLFSFIFIIQCTSFLLPRLVFHFNSIDTFLLYIISRFILHCLHYGFALKFIRLVFACERALFCSVSIAMSRYSCSSQSLRIRMGNNRLRERERGGKSAKRNRNIQQFWYCCHCLLFPI